MATPIRFNANAVITAAFSDLGVFQPGEAIPNADAQGALDRLNALISAWQLSPLTCPFTTREVFSVVASQSTYTIGPGGNFDTVRPMAVTAAGLLFPLVSATTGKIEIPIPVLTEQAYEAIAAKDLQSTLWTAVFYNPSYSGGLGSVYLWPTPTTTTYKCVLYREDPIVGFANLVTLYDFPPGYFEAMEYQLAKRLAPSYGGAGWTAQLEELARDAMFLVKRQNFSLVDQALDPAMTGTRRGGYNIETGTGG